MNQTLRTLFRFLFFGAEGVDSTVPGGTDFASLSEIGTGAALREFAEALSESDSPVSRLPASPDPIRTFLQEGARRVQDEMTGLWDTDPSFRETVTAATSALTAQSPDTWNADTRNALWSVFFPEGAGTEHSPRATIDRIRKKRAISDIRMNPSPLTDPAKELLFTSNVLLAPPAPGTDPKTLDLPDRMIAEIIAAAAEPQVYFYDHPIHIGTPPESNEALYGLRGLNETIAYEKAEGRVAPDVRATVVLSLSVTHSGLHALAKPYLQEQIKRYADFPHLTVYLFTEPDCRRIVQDVIAAYLPADTSERLIEVFGVDGEYGRHYSFLKAIAAFWHVFIDPRIRATFKIDLDQVFPQKELEDQSGESALTHFTTPLWGATGTDADGNPVDLGMIAGALVNESDIHRGIFTPDVTPPETIPAGEAAVFYNRLPMALSTQAEMMTRYGEDTGIGGGPTAPDNPTAAGDSARTPDGIHRCSQRFHVTGGTNGILVDRLRKYRPFTPTFIGRAEDQAYILSVLFEAVDGRFLRYLHKPGLLMRHDKEAFAAASIAHATTGRFIGDLQRTVFFTRYAQSLPWGAARTKEQIDPFTGCFVSRRVVSLVFLRLVLYAAGRNEAEREEILALAERKLKPLFDDTGESNGSAGSIADTYRTQREAWHRYYEALDAAETDERLSDRKADAGRIIEGCRII